MVLLDTDTLTHLHANQANAVRNFHACTDPDIGTTIVTRIEIVKGRFDFLLKADAPELFLRAQRLLLEAEHRLQKMLVLLLDTNSLDRFQYLRQVKGLRKIGRADLLIASITLANDATLVTRNKRDFKQIPKLKLANWVD